MIAALKAMETLKQDWVQTEERENQSRIPVRQLGDYHLLREVGRGGMGIVFEALQESLDRRVALKLLPRHVVTRESHVRRLQREARTAAGLHHSNIIPVFDVGEDDGYHYIIMQLIEGVSMDRVLALLRRETTADLAAALPTSSVSALGEMAASRLMSFLPDGAVTAPIVPVLSSLAAVSSLPPTLSHVSGLSSDEEQTPEGRRLPPGANGRIVRPTRPGPPAPNRSLPDIDHQAWLQTGISQLETLLNDQQDPKHRFLLALCLRDYGRGFNNVHEQRAIEILRALSVQEPDSATYQFELANTLRDFPFHRLQKVHQDVALRRLREASEILQKLVTADPTQHSYRFILADLFHRRADVVAQQARGLSGVASESALSEAEILSELAFQNHQDAFRGAGFSVTASQGLTRILAAHLEILFGNGRTPHAILTLERMRHVMADETLRMDNEEKELVQQHMEFLQTRFYGDPENGITGIVPPGRAHGGRGPRPEFRSDSANRNERTPAQQRAGDR